MISKQQLDGTASDCVVHILDRHADGLRARGAIDTLIRAGKIGAESDPDGAVGHRFATPGGTVGNSPSGTFRPRRAARSWRRSALRTSQRARISSWVEAECRPAGDEEPV